LLVENVSQKIAVPLSCMPQFRVTGLGIGVEVVVGVVTVTPAEAEALPPAPVHVTLYEMFEVGETVTLPPEAVMPRPAHEDAFVELHESVDDCPDVIEVGFPLNVTVGAGVGVGGGDPEK
jgi:hypothetical protein